MKYAITLFLLCSLFSASGQNMVHNSGFEQMVACPTAYSQLDAAHVVDWFTPTSGSSDYFNACSPVAGTPGNFFGTQVPYDGVAYAGFYAWPGPAFKEYVGGNLDPLVIGKKYRVTIHISRADTYEFGVDGIGVFFYINATIPQVQTLPMVPQVDYSNYGTIGDEINWVTLTDTILADSAYTKLIIGEYKTDATIDIDTFNGTQPWSYYFVDGVEVVPISFYASPSHTNITCNGANNGTATVTPFNGNPPYTYLWLPGNQTTQSITGLAAGSYTCIVVDSTQDSSIASVLITQPAALAVSASQTNPCANTNNGTATVSVTGGIGPYTYFWAPTGGNNATATGLSAGNYTCTITDSNACTVSQAFTLINTQPLTATTSQLNILCNGDASGTATVNISGGTAPYTYLWTPVGGNNATATGLTAGSYTCTATDLNNCSIAEIFTLTQPPALTALDAQTNISCWGAADGAASVNVSGGVVPYTFSWAPAGGIAASASNLATGSYTCTITDANACILTQTFNITQPQELVLTGAITDVTCNGLNNGTAAITASGGTAAYTYSWAPAGGNMSTALGLPAGAYTCTVTDSHNCTAAHSFNISEPGPITVRTSKQDVLCKDKNNGFATCYVTSGGTPPFTYSWQPQGGSDTIAHYLAAGNYTCTVTDSNNCSLQQAFSISDISQPFSYSVTDSDIACRTSLLTAIPGEGSVPATQLLWWFNNDTVANDNPVTHTFADTGINGVYLVITDAIGCRDTLRHIFNINYHIVADFSIVPQVPLPNKPIQLLNLSSPNATVFHWDFGDNTYDTEKNTLKTYEDSGAYTICLVASDSANCQDEICKDVSITLENAIGIPSAFSPNGDGFNDILYVRGYRIKAFRLRIYNRWGNLIFETDNKAKGWDGTYKGQPQVGEVYAYTLEATFTDGSTVQKAGSISLLR